MNDVTSGSGRASTSLIKTTEVTQDNDEEAETNLLASSFENELAWCIQQLELGIVNGEKSKDGIKKAADAAKVLKVLRSASAPLVKKRCVMKATFGDYRKKMEAIKKESDSAWKKSGITTLAPDHMPPSSKFIRKSTAGCKSQKTDAKLESEHNNENVSGRNSMAEFAECCSINDGESQTVKSSDQEDPNISKDELKVTELNSGGFSFNFDVENI